MGLCLFIRTFFPYTLCYGFCLYIAICPVEGGGGSGYRSGSNKGPTTWQGVVDNLVSGIVSIIMIVILMVIILISCCFCSWCPAYGFFHERRDQQRMPEGNLNVGGHSSGRAVQTVSGSLNNMETEEDRRHGGKHGFLDTAPPSYDSVMGPAGQGPQWNSNYYTTFQPPNYIGQQMGP